MVLRAYRLWPAAILLRATHLSQSQSPRQCVNRVTSFKPISYRETKHFREATSRRPINFGLAMNDQTSGQSWVCYLLKQQGQAVQPRVGDLGYTDVGLEGSGEVGDRLGMAAGQSVEDGGLAGLRVTQEPDLHGYRMA